MKNRNYRLQSFTCTHTNTRVYYIKGNKGVGNATAVSFYILLLIMLYLQGKKSLFLFPSFFSYTHLHTCIHTHLQHKTIFLPLVKTRETDSEHGSFIANSNNRTNNNILQPPEQKKKGRREEEHGEKPLIQQYPGSFRSNRNRFLDMIKHLSVVYTPQFQNLPKTSPFSSRQPATATTTIITAS